VKYSTFGIAVSRVRPNTEIYTRDWDIGSTWCVEFKMYCSVVEAKILDVSAYLSGM
jgi:hypothetical protein